MTRRYNCVPKYTWQVFLRPPPYDNASRAVWALWITSAHSADCRSSSSISLCFWVAIASSTFLCASSIHTISWSCGWGSAVWFFPIVRTPKYFFDQSRITYFQPVYHLADNTFCLRGPFNKIVELEETPYWKQNAFAGCWCMGESKTPVVTMPGPVWVDIRYLKRIYFGIFTLDGAISAVFVPQCYQKSTRGRTYPQVWGKLLGVYDQSLPKVKYKSIHTA